MSIDLNKYDYDGWFEGVDGDETAYALLFDKENSYRTHIKPMDMEEAKTLYESIHNKEEGSDNSKGNGKIVLAAALIGAGVYAGIKSGAFTKAGKWIKSKFKKKEIAISKEKAE